MRKRTRSSTYLTRPAPQQLHDIHEEDEHHLEHTASNREHLSHSDSKQMQ